MKELQEIQKCMSVTLREALEASLSLNGRDTTQLPGQINLTQVARTRTHASETFAGCQLYTAINTRQLVELGVLARGQRHVPNPPAKTNRANEIMAFFAGPTCQQNKWSTTVVCVGVRLVRVNPHNCAQHM